MKDKDMGWIESSSLKKAGLVGIGASILFPLIGIILFFAANRTKISNPSVYLKVAIISLVAQGIMPILYSWFYVLFG